MILGLQKQSPGLTPWIWNLGVWIIFKSVISKVKEKYSYEGWKKSLQQNKTYIYYLNKVSHHLCVWLSTCTNAWVYSSLFLLSLYSHRKVSAYHSHTSWCFYSTKPVNVPRYFAIGWLYSHSWIMFNWQEVLKQQIAQGLMDLPSPSFM